MRIFLFIYLFFILSCSREVDNTDNIISFGSEETLDIITWNLEWFPKNESTISFVSDFILSLSPDIIALQEISDQYSFNLLIESLGQGWVGYRDNTDYQELSYIINLNQVSVIEEPYEILNNYEYFFAYRPPYLVNIEFNNEVFSIIDIHLKCCDGSEDRRRSILKLTEQGKHIHQKLSKAALQIEQILTQELNEEEVSVINKIFEKLTKRTELFTEINLEAQ